MEMIEKLEFVGRHDPEGAAKLSRLLGRIDALKEGNVYGERFTERQFFLVFGPLLEASYERARLLEALSEKENTVGGLSEKLGMKPDIVFGHMKDLVKKNQVEIAGHEGRDALFRRK
jgi:hypothetical protein